MTGKQLKNSILQWAIQGKLVPQDPNDEPASVLLERIREEKARLIKEKKIKKPKNESFIFRGDDNSYYEKHADGTTRCIDDEIPFEIPSHWCWTRFETVMINRDTERIPLSVSERSCLKKIYDYYGASGVIDKVDKYLFDKPLLLIGEDGANLINRSTPIAFIAKGQYWVNNHAHVLDCSSDILMEYMCNYINSISLVDYVTGTAQPKMNQEKMNSILIALPPLQEQKRINRVIEQILPNIEKYNVQRLKLDALNCSIKQLLKASILQEAIQGRLVPQCAEEEPASALLQRIKAEKEGLIKEKKIKRDKNESVIFRDDDNRYYEKIGKECRCIQDDIPFEIPGSWTWARLDSITYSTGSKINQIQSKEILNTGSIPVVSQGQNLIDGYSNDYEKIIDELPLIMFGDHTRNVKFIDFSFVIGADGTKFHKCILINPKYLYFWMTIAAEKLRDRGYARHYTLLKQTFIPLPPLEEQHRIVDKIEEVFKKL